MEMMAATQACAEFAGTGFVGAGSGAGGVVAFLGPPASYSHQATRSAFTEPDWTLLPTGTIKEVFEAVQSSRASYGVVPFENSSHGIVTFTLDELADRQHTLSDIMVCAETYLDVHHFLLGKKQGQAQNLKHIRRIYSHPQALGQTAAFLKTHMPEAEMVETSSTSRAAELVAREGGNSAAVAGEMAAGTFGLDVLARNIEDNRECNVTRFFVLRKRGHEGAGPAWPSVLNSAGQQVSHEWAERRFKSLLSFTVPQRNPEALANVLGCLRAGGLNLTSINSLPSLIAPFQYLFFVEFEGSAQDAESGGIEGALEEIERIAPDARWHGNWVRRRF